ncbi:MAG TPA: hypothetical protein VKE24_00240 [Candidatus Acidoferrales bacterium]|nr:hypothetical protein [Candidatus Acidoferrales bacterium]
MLTGKMVFASGQYGDFDIFHDVDGLMRLRAVCREALELLPRLAFYLGEKERVRKFQEATSQPLDSEAGQVIAEIIQEKLDSDQF